MFQKKIITFLFLLYVCCGYANEARIEWQHYTSSPSIKEQLSDYLLFKWDQKKDFTKGPFYFDSHFQFEYSLDRSDFIYFNISELYLFYKYELEKPLYSVESIEFHLGRKIKNWSEGDEYWDLGLWNPLTRWNPLHPVTNGLVGSFLTLKAKRWESDFFIGALYLPSLEAKRIEEERENLYSFPLGVSFT